MDLRILPAFQEYRPVNKFSADEFDATCLLWYHHTTLSLGEKRTCKGDFGEPQGPNRPHGKKQRDPWFFGTTWPECGEPKNVAPSPPRLN